jgi:SAM-dependent methyltransferase
MDGRELAFADASFDVVFSISSIEHFGSPADTARAASEIGRVLRPGGHAVIATECFVRHHPLDRAPVDAAVRVVSLNTKRRKATLRRRGVIDEVFTARELRCRIVEPSGLELMQPLTLGVAPESWDNLTVTHPDGRLEPRTGEHWPHVLLRYRRSIFTSVCLVLEKPGG